MHFELRKQKKMGGHRAFSAFFRSPKIGCLGCKNADKLCTYSAVTLFTELTLMFFFFYRIALMYWNLKKKKKESTKRLARSKRSFFPYLEKF